jgi:hypothetical protein
MSTIALSFAPSGEMAVVTLCGALHRSDMDAAVDLLCQAKDYRPRTTIVWDLQHAQIQLTPKEIGALIRILSHRPDARGGKHAVVVDSNFDYGMARVAQAYTEAWLQAECMVFRDWEAASDWVEDVSGAKLH